MSWCDKVLKDSARYWEKYVYPGVSWGGENGLFIGGVSDSNTNWNNTIDLITISTAGNAVDFGDATTSHPGQHSGCSNGTVVLFGPGGTGTAIHKVLFSNKSNSSAHGNLYYARDYLSSCGNKTRSIFGPGRSQVTAIEFFEYPTGGTAVSFGSMSRESSYGGASANDTRGIFMLGLSNLGVENTIHYITISQTANSVDFGDLRSNKDCLSSFCCGDGKVIMAYGRYQAGYTAEIDYVRIHTLSNASEFGVISNLRIQSSACSNGIRGVFGGGYSLAYNNNSDAIEYITGSYLCNPVNFGNLTSRRGFLASGAGN